MAKRDRPQRTGPLEEQHEQDAHEHGSYDISDTRPTMISAEQQRRDQHQEQSVANVRFEHVSSTSSKDDFLGVGVTAAARNAVGAIALVVGTPWPPRAVTMRGLDAEGRGGSFGEEGRGHRVGARRRRGA